MVICWAVSSWHGRVVRAMWVVCCQSSGTEKKPVNQCLQGVGDDVEVVGGWHGRQYGCLGVSRRCRVGWLGFVARVDENEKINTVNIGLHGYCSSPELNRLV